MANYTNLKAAVAAAIKANGNQEITGQILQANLLSIIDNFGANRTFAGMAEPSTMPPSILDANVFYVIYKKGTYTNFGNLVNPKDELAFIINTGTNQWQLISTGSSGSEEVYIGSTAPTDVNTKLWVQTSDLDILRAIRDANPTSQLPALWLDSEDPYTQWEGVQWSQTTPKKIEVLSIGSLSINSLNGVNNLKSLIRIICPANNITSLDLSNMPNLGYVNCGVNNISIFSISNSPNIYQLQVWSNKISAIDLSLIIDKLKVLELDHNLLTSIPSLTYKNNLYTYYDFRYNNMPTLETSRIIGLNFDSAKVLPQNP